MAGGSDTRVFRLLRLNEYTMGERGNSWEQAEGRYLQCKRYATHIMIWSLINKMFTAVKIAILYLHVEYKITNE